MAKYVFRGRLDYRLNTKGIAIRGFMYFTLKFFSAQLVIHRWFANVIIFWIFF